MKPLRRFWNRMGGVLFGRQHEAEMARELEMHIQMQTEDNLRCGMSPGEARREAVLKFGAVEAAKESYRDQRGLPQFDILRQDLRYALRQLRKTPAFTVVVILTLALGIGANTAIFSAMNVALWRALPVHDPARLLFLNTTLQFGAQSGDGDTSLTEYIFEQLRLQREVLSDLVGFAPISNQRVGVRYGREPEEALVDVVSGNFFSGLGVEAALGRTFRVEDETHHAPLAVVSYAYWSERVGRDPAVLGHPLFIKGIPFTIIGVAAPKFIGVEHRRVTDVWIPLQTHPDLQPWGQPPGAGLSLYGSAHLWWCLKTIGRLQPNVTETQALARLQPVFLHAAMEGAHRDPKFENPKLYFTPARGIDGLRDSYKEPLMVLMVMVGLVLSIACANIAMLLIARNAARRREFSLRLALGVSRARLFRQLITESLLLVGAGALLGWMFALWVTQALAAWSHLNINFAPDRMVLWFTAGVSLVVGLLFGLAPLRGVLRIPLCDSLRTSATSANSDRGGLRLGRVVVALQVSLCVALLAGAGLLVETLRRIETVDLGIRASGLLVFGVSPQNMNTKEEALRFYQALLDRLQALPGVDAATLMRQRIGSGWSANSSFQLDGADPAGDANSHIRWNGVGPDYFHVLGTRVLLGRDFAASDTASAPRVAIVNETLARRYLAGRDPLGHQITRGDNLPCTIIGLVADSKYASVDEKPMPMAWFPYTQFDALAEVHIELRTARDPASLLPEVRRAMLQFAPELPLLQPMTQQEQFERSYAQSRLLARLSIFFGLLAALLVATGLYGTLAYTVSRRTVEVGIRMALGARRVQVLWMVLRASLVVSAAGVVIGLPLAIVGAKFLDSMLFGVKWGDPRFFGAAVVGIALVTFAASWIPAQRAASVDPIQALHAE
jgi:predicted permease